MADIDAICAAAAKVLSEATGLRPFDYIPESINPPAAIVVVTSIEPSTFHLESMDVTLDLVVLVARSRSGQDQLQAYISHTGPQSVWLALAAHPNLGLTDGTQATIVRYRSLGVEEIAAYQYAGGAFETAVTT